TLALAKLPSDPTQIMGALQPYAGATLLIAGTAGASWVPFSYPGELHVLVLDEHYRVPYATPGSGQSAAVNTARNQGVLFEPSPFPLSFTGKHLFGSITVTGQMVFFGLAASGFPADIYAINQLSGLVGGGTYALDLGNINPALTGNSLAT